MDASEIKDWKPSETIRFRSTPADLEKFTANHVWKDIQFCLTERIKENLSILTKVNVREQWDLALTCQQNIAVCEAVLSLPAVILDAVNTAAKMNDPESEEREAYAHAQGSDCYE